MEQSIQLVGILFILSMICERISNFFKIWLSNTIDKYKLGFGNMTKKGVTNTDEKNRELRILKINIFFGFLTAFCINADLIKIINSIKEPSSAIGWSNYNSEWKRLPISIVGWLMTGLFISLGSKFWHDLLDILLQVKDLKRKLVDERPYQNLESISQFDEFVKTPESKLSQLAYDKYGNEIKAIKGVLTVGTGYKDAAGGKIGCIEIHVLQTVNLSLIPNQYAIELNTGLKITIPTKVVIVDGYPQAATTNAGGKIANASQKLGWGTLGAVVKDTVTNESYILSCHHVLNGDYNWLGVSASKDIIDENNKSIATVSFGFRTNEFDTAIATIKDGMNLNNSSIGNPNKIKEVLPIDAIKEIKVKVLGEKTNKTEEGFVYNDSWDTLLLYPDGKLWELKDLLVLTKLVDNNYKAISQSGDSGALIRDADNNAIGMVVGGNDLFTYAIKMKKIETAFGIKF